MTLAYPCLLTDAPSVAAAEHAATPQKAGVVTSRSGWIFARTGVGTEPSTGPWSFPLHRSHLSDPTRLARSLIASCLASLWLVYLGVDALRDGWLKWFHRL